MKLEPHEIEKVNRIYMAKWLGISPAELDALPQSDIDDAREIMWYESEKAAAAKRRRRK